ncbi:MAG: acetylxylan esterase [Armatimonadota bacterium]|nr:acetylxylan esterase [Armatimonadota bacterium]
MIVLRVTLVILLLASTARNVEAMDLEVGPVADQRFSLVRHLNMEYDVSKMASQYKTREEWEKRAREIREQILGAAGLLPMPRRCLLNARIFGRIDHGDYTVEKAYFESYPGFYCTGNLYRPKGKGPFPGVLNTHGHWAEGRFVDNESSSIPTRAANLAKQGYVVFSYDMIGFNDSKQVTIPEKHDALGDRRNRLWGISLGGLQTWNSIRAIDFLQSLPDVDPARIAVTGASGGGTQTFLVTAVDDRVTVSAPVCMVSAHMQGGCRCENLPNLRIDTNNVEITATAAPRPLFLVAATGDWTKNTLEIECPAIRSIYKLFGAEDKLACVRFEAGHNYNKNSREAVYTFFAKWLKNSDLTYVKEEAVKLDSKTDLLCFPDGKLPEGSLAPDEITNQLMKESEKQLVENLPKDEDTLARFRKLYEPALRTALAIPSRFAPTVELRGELLLDGITVRKIVIRDSIREAQIPALVFLPQHYAGDGTPLQVALLVHEHGKVAFLSADGRAPGELVKGLIEKGWCVIAVDVFNTGEHTAPEGSPERNFDKDFFDTYNRTDTAERVYDIVLTLKLVRSNAFCAVSGRREPGKVAIAGLGKAGLWCLLAAPFSEVDRLAVDVVGIDVSNDKVLLDDYYVPCLRRAGDFRTAVALTAPTNLLIYNTQGRFDTSWAVAAYSAAASQERLQILQDKPAEKEIAAWLCGNW